MAGFLADWRAALQARGESTLAVGHALHARYARLFWALHSIWALSSGVAVLVLAHNRYGFVRWAVLFLALTWASTLFFSRFAVGGGSGAMRFAQGVVSYMTRVMYQETLFFLLPFYFYSTTFPSWNSAYVVVLALLAILSCFDMLFDRLLRESPAFALGFFAFVSYSALQLFLPIVFRFRIANSAYLAGAVSFIAAIALAGVGRELLRPKALALTALAFIATLGVVRLTRLFTPPVPLRLTKVRVSASFDRKSLRSSEDLGEVIPRARLRNGRLYVTATVFSPSRLPAAVRMQFVSDGKILRSSKETEFVAHPAGFRVWDSLRGGPSGFKPGTYRVEVWTATGQLIGRRSVRVVSE